MNPNKLLFGGLFLLSACIGPRKIDKWVAREYEGASPASEKKKADYISISSSVPPIDGRYSTTEKKFSHVLPLIFYWHLHYDNICTLNPEIPVNNFVNGFTGYASSKKLKQKLNGRRIELSVDSIPHVLSINDNGHLIWFVLYAYGWDILDIMPDNNSLVVSYKILNDNEEIKKGIITIPDANKHLHLKMFQSVKKKTWEYLDQYNANITSMSRQVVDKLMAEL